MSLIRRSFIYLGSSLLAKGIPFLLLPYITRVLEPSEFGRASMVMLYFGLFTVIVGSNSHSIVVRNFFREKVNDDFNSLLGAVFVYNLCNFFISLLLIGVLSLFLGEVSDIPISYLFLLSALAFFSSVNQNSLTIYRCKEQPIKYAINEVGLSILQVSSILFYINSVGETWHYQIFSLTVSLFIFGILGYIQIAKQYSISFKISKYKEVFSLCFPQIFHLFGGFILAIGDRWLIEGLLGSSALGIYVTAYSFGMILGVLADAYSRSFSPEIYKLLNKEKEGLFLANNVLFKTFLFFLMFSVFYFFISYFSFGFLIGSDYQEGRNILWVIILGVFFQSLYKFIFPFLFHDGKVINLVVVNIFSAILNFTINIFLIPIYGLMGSAIATMVAYFIVFFYCFYLKIKLENYNCA